MNESRPGLGQQGLGAQPSTHQPLGLGGRITPQAAQSAIRPTGSAAVAAPAVKPPAPRPAEDELESIALEEVDDPTPTPATPAPGAASPAAPAAQPASKIHGFNVGGTMYGQEQFKRTPNLNKNGACRVRSFHGRLSDSGLDYLDHSVNDWLDKHPEIEVKFVTSTTGMYDGKIKEPALILNLWY